MSVYLLCLQGFEPRGTEISDRLTAYDNLLSDPDLLQAPSDHAAVIQELDKLLVYHEEPENSSREFVHQKRDASRRKKQFFCDVPGTINKSSSLQLKVLD